MYRPTEPEGRGGAILVKSSFLYIFNTISHPEFMSYIKNTIALKFMSYINQKLQPSYQTVLNLSLTEIENFEK